MSTFYGEINFPEYKSKNKKKNEKYNKIQKWIETNKTIFLELGDIISIDNSSSYIWCLDNNFQNNLHKFLVSLTKKINIANIHETDIEEYEVSDIISPMFIQNYHFYGESSVMKYIFIGEKPSYRFSTLNSKNKFSKNSFNEMINFGYLECLSKGIENFNEYLLCQYQPAYGKEKNIKFINYFTNSITIKRLNSLISINRDWLESAKNTASAIKKSRIFNQNLEYQYYSETETEYALIFKKPLNILKNNDNEILSSYGKTLLSDKYFISDAIVTTESAYKQILDKANKLTVKSTINDFQQLFSMMDIFFNQKKFIPISFKYIENPLNITKIKSKTNLDIEKKSNIVKAIKNVGSNKIKIINPPSGTTSYEQIDILDFIIYEMLADIKLGGNINKYLGKTIFINYNTFKYSKKIKEYTYGGSSYENDYVMYFEFDVRYGNRKKTYTFSVENSIKIRTLGSASATGEGTINLQSINFIMNDVHSGQYNKELKEIANTRLDILTEKLKINKLEISKLKNPESKKLIGDYQRLLGKPELLNPSKFSGFLKLIKNFTNYTTKDDDELLLVKLTCSEALSTYINSLQKSVMGLKKGKVNITYSDINLIKQELNKQKKELSSINYSFLNEVFASELGLLIDKDKELIIEFDGNSLKVELPEIKKKKLILSAWGLISGRGAIVFDDQIFKDAKSIKDIMYTKIKLPALIKIGI